MNMVDTGVYYCLLLDVYYWWNTELDGVGHLDNRPSPYKLKHVANFHFKCYTWHLTFDMLHMTCDTCIYIYFF